LLFLSFAVAAVMSGTGYPVCNGHYTCTKYTGFDNVLPRYWN